MAKKIIYSRGFPYGAPLVMLRGGATRDPYVKQFLKDQRFKWDNQLHAWSSYMYAPELTEILVTLRDDYGCTIQPKSDLDPDYVIQLRMFSDSRRTKPTLPLFESGKPELAEEISERYGDGRRTEIQ